MSMTWGEANPCLYADVTFAASKLDHAVSLMDESIETIEGVSVLEALREAQIALNNAVCRYLEDDENG